MAKAAMVPGIGQKLSKLEVAMNRAAEAAAALATTIFATAIGNMTFTDAKAILNGESNAATQYFVGTTRENLFRLFLPVVESRLGALGVGAMLSTILDMYASIPYIAKPTAFNLEDYVTGLALDGLFLKFGEQEKKIRCDVGAQTSALLKKVFGALTPM